ncbi:MAG: class I SAM-dependent methyltransferase, partial [Proteobacteria bacterium]
MAVVFAAIMGLLCVFCVCFALWTGYHFLNRLDEIARQDDITEQTRAILKDVLLTQSGASESRPHPAPLTNSAKEDNGSMHSIALLAPLIPEGSHLLDFGCGNMYTAIQLLGIKPNLTITGLDIIRDQNLTDEILSDNRLRFQLSSTKEIPAADNSFDGAIALATLHHTPDPEYFLSELVRV